MEGLSSQATASQLRMKGDVPHTTGVDVDGAEAAKLFAAK
jgi:hypothetical protein